MNCDKLYPIDTNLTQETLWTEQKIIAWQVVFESGAVELWSAEDVVGSPAFGRWVTPLVSGGPVIDNGDDSE